MKPDSSRSLIAFVQRHRMDVVITDEGDYAVIASWQSPLPVMKAGVTFATGKTWTAAVRKAKRIIEKGKK
jgi:hypothetical protein